MNGRGDRILRRVLAGGAIKRGWTDWNLGIGVSGVLFCGRKGRQSREKDVSLNTLDLPQGPGANEVRG